MSNYTQTTQTSEDEILHNIELLHNHAKLLTRELLTCDSDLEDSDIAVSELQKRINQLQQKLDQSKQTISQLQQANKALNDKVMHLETINSPETFAFHDAKVACEAMNGVHQVNYCEEHSPEFSNWNEVLVGLKSDADISTLGHCCDIHA